MSQENYEGGLQYESFFSTTIPIRTTTGPTNLDDDHEPKTS